MYSHVFKRLTQWQAEQIVPPILVWKPVVCSIFSLLGLISVCSLVQTAYFPTGALEHNWCKISTYLFRAYSPIMILTTLGYKMIFCTQR